MYQEDLCCPSCKSIKVDFIKSKGKSEQYVCEICGEFFEVIVDEGSK